MSSNVTTRKSFRVGAGLLGAGVVAALLLTPVTGADFSASDTGRVDVSTATLSIGLTDDKGSTGTFDLDFTNLKPGEVKTQTFHVTNTGSIDATAKIGAPITGASFTGGVGTLTQADLNEFKVGVVGYQNLVAAPSLANGSINLGTIAAGQTKAYTVQVGLDQTAGNEWQGRSVGATATVTLTQN